MVETLILRPVKDKQLQHSCNTGSSGATLISESSADDDSTYIFQQVSFNSANSVTSSFNLEKKKIKSGNLVSSIKITLRAKKVGASTTGSVSPVLSFQKVNLTSTESSVTDTWTDYVFTIASVKEINDFLSTKGQLPQLILKINTAGSNVSFKETGAAIRITQAFVSLEIAAQTSESLLIKENGQWIKYNTVYQKKNGKWQAIPYEMVFQNYKNGQITPYIKAGGKK